MPRAFLHKFIQTINVSQVWHKTETETETETEKPYVLLTVESSLRALDPALVSEPAAAPWDGGRGAVRTAAAGAATAAAAGGCRAALQEQVLAGAPRGRRGLAVHR